MTVIGVERPPVSLSLNSCPSCGQHVWSSDGREVDRTEVLAALRVSRGHSVARQPAPAVRGSDAVLDTADGPSQTGRRSELQRLLDGFIVHGSTS